MKKLLLVTVCLCLMSGCATQISSVSAAALSGLSASKTIGFVPIEPIPAEGMVEVVRNGAIEEVDIRTLSKDELLAELADTRSKITVAKVTSDGSLSYLTGSITQEKGTYVAHMDFTNFFIDDLIDKDSGTVLGRARIGIGLRLVAQVKTRKRGIDLGSLIKIGVAASKSELTGALEVRAIGITSDEVLSLLPGVLPSVDETAIQSALESMAAVKAKIYEADTVVRARVVAVELNETTSEGEVSDLKGPDPI